MPPNENGECYILISLDVDDQPTLGAFRECSRKAMNLEEFVTLIRKSIAKNELFKVLSSEENSKLGPPHSKHLFKVGK